MDFQACKGCEHLHQMISGDRVKNLCLRTGTPKRPPSPIESMHKCPGFKKSGVQLWETVDVGDCYVVARKRKDGKGSTVLTIRNEITATPEWLYFFSKNAAELTAASLNQEVYARMIQRDIEKRRSDGYEE